MFGIERVVAIWGLCYYLYHTFLVHFLLLGVLEEDVVLPRMYVGLQ